MDDVVIMIKGAFGRVLSKCSHYYNEGEKIPLDDDARNSIEKMYSAMCQVFFLALEVPNFALEESLRALGFAEKVCSSFDEFLTKDLTTWIKEDCEDTSGDSDRFCFIGLAGMRDNPRYS